MTSLMTKAEGTSMVIETIFENRFMHLAELKRMGANVKLKEEVRLLRVDASLRSKVRATDLRAGAALVLAGLVAEGLPKLRK